jgi:hypothetical protein
MFVALTFCLSGCMSAGTKIDATRKAVDDHLIQGLTESNKFDSIVWFFPGGDMPVWIYSDISSIASHITDGPEKGRSIVFFLGKSRISKEWEVFAAQIWKNGNWELCPVKLPEYKKTNDSNQSAHATGKSVPNR